MMAAPARVRGLPRPVEAGPCNAKTVRCPDARDYRSELKPCCRQHVRDLMGLIAPALNDLGVDWWADYGTLLGGVRNPLTTWADYPWLRQTDRETAGPAAGIIPHDKDADLGLLFRDWDKVQARMRALSGPPHRLGVLINMHRGSIKVRLSLKNHTNVDLFFWHERKPYGRLFRYAYASVDAFKGREFHKDLLWPLRTVEWEGMTLPAPRHPEAFLEMRYGPKWRRPVMANNDGVPRR